MGGVFGRTNEIYCWHAKPHPLTKNSEWSLMLCLKNDQSREQISDPVKPFGYANPFYPPQLPIPYCVS